jgi:hypothetical protein
MHDHLNTTPDTSSETLPARTLSKADLETIELQVRDRLMEGDSEGELRALTSTLLENAGQAPLSENETERTFMLDIDGEEVERTLVVDPNDFGTFVRSTSEMGIEGLADEDDSHEAAAPEAKVEHDLGEQALKAVEAVDTAEPTGEDDPVIDDAEYETAAEHKVTPSAELDELLNDSAWKNIDSLTGQVQSRTRALMTELDQLDRLLSAINYAGGRTETSTAQLAQSLESLRRMTSGDTDEDLASRARSLRSRAEEAVNTVRHDNDASDENRHHARLAEENVEEVAQASRVVHGEFDELRAMLAPYGAFAQNIDELSRSTNGYQYTIGLLKSAVKTATDHSTMAYGRLGTIEARIEDISRLRRAQ